MRAAVACSLILTATANNTVYQAPPLTLPTTTHNSHRERNADHPRTAAAIPSSRSTTRGGCTFNVGIASYRMLQLYAMWNVR